MSRSRQRCRSIIVTVLSCASLLLMLQAGHLPQQVAQAAENDSSESAETQGDADDRAAVLELAKRIDERISARLRAEGVEPAPQADDAEFFRRLCLDLTGRIPRASAARDFLADDRANKRLAAAEELLKSPLAVIHSTNLWREALIPEAETQVEIRSTLPGFEAWLRARLAENRSYREIVEEILTLPLQRSDLQQQFRPERATPSAFFLAKEARPEGVAAASARVFLGVRIDCAQCHDHPYDSWTQEQFWQQAAFFTDVPQIPVPGSVEQVSVLTPGQIAIPELDKTVAATFLDGDRASVDELGSGESPRQLLAEWITSRENPWFARAAVNRLWSHYFGRGLVEPMDDFSSFNPPTHPELLDLLAESFREHDYNFRFISRAIVATDAYQRTSVQTEPAHSRPELYACMPVRGLTPEQTFDTLAQAVGYQQPFNPEEPLNFNNDPARQEFLELFSNSGASPIDRTSTILQALSMMNGQFISEATDLTRSQTLAAVTDAPFLSTREKIETLYLATLSRFPNDQERAQLTDFIEGQDSQVDSEAALADIFWALLNSSEFLLNH